jgi:hypothetical protein
VSINPKRPHKWLSGKSVLEKARKYLNSGNVISTPHLKKRMEEKHFDMHDVINIIENGKILKPPEWNEEFGQFRYVVKGKDVEGVELNIVITISTKEEILTIITGF